MWKKIRNKYISKIDSQSMKTGCQSAVTGWQSAVTGWQAVSAAIHRK